MWRFVLGAKRAIGLKCHGTTSAIVQAFPSEEPATPLHYGTSSCSSVHSDTYQSSHHRFGRHEKQQWSWDDEVKNPLHDGQCIQHGRRGHIDHCRRFDDGSEQHEEHEGQRRGPERDAREHWHACRHDMWACGQHSRHFVEAVGWGTAVVLAFQATQICHQKQRYVGDSTCLVQRIVSSASSAIPRLLFDAQNWTSFGCSSIKSVLPHNIKLIPAVQRDSRSLSPEKVEMKDVSVTTFMSPGATFMHQRTESNVTPSVFTPSLFVPRGNEMWKDMLSMEELLSNLEKAIPSLQTEITEQPPSPSVNESEASVADTTKAAAVSEQKQTAVGLAVSLEHVVAEWQQLSRDYVAMLDNATAVRLARQGDMAGAVSLWTSVAEDTDCDKVYFNLGLCHERGLGIDQDEIKASEYYRKAADRGNSRAAYNLALLLLRGDQAQNVDTAVDLLTNAAQQGLAEAQRELGVLFTEEPRQDFKRAVVLFQQAAAQNDTKACFFLGVCYERGIGVARDTDKAVEVYTIAADSGHADAQYNLAVLLGSVKTEQGENGSAQYNLKNTGIVDTKYSTSTAESHSNCAKTDQLLEPKGLMVSRIPRNLSSGTMRLLSTGSDDNESSCDSSNDGKFFIKPRISSERSRFYLGNSSDSEDDDWLQDVSSGCKDRERATRDIESFDILSQSGMVRRKAQ